MQDTSAATYLDTVMHAVNERLLSEIARTATEEAARRVRGGQSIEDVNIEMKALLPHWEAWRVQAYRAIRQSISDFVDAVVMRHREDAVVH